MEKTKPEILKVRIKKQYEKFEFMCLDRWWFCEENLWKFAFSLQFFFCNRINDVWFQLLAINENERR